MIYAFGECELDTARRELRRGGHLVEVEPQVFVVLCYLLVHRDRVVPKDELLDQCWPDTFVTESALARCLTRLRKAVQDGSTAPLVIKTLHRQGYRFVAEVTELRHESSSDTVAALPSTAPLSYLSGFAAQPLSSDIAVQSETQQATSVQSAPAFRQSSAAERRQLTVMFCDVVDSTPLAGQLDPEDFRDVILRYHATCAHVIQRYEGYIAQYLGDGLLVYFGYPQSYEDAARRAVQAGLDILTAIEDLCRQLIQEYRIRLALRIGIHTGLVVIGEMGGGPQHGPLALGAPPNLAAKIQGLAAPDSLVISAVTHHLVQGYFACQLLGKPMFAGVAAPMALYQVFHPSGAQGRLDIVTSRGLTPLVGRDREVNTLLHCWQHIRNGSGHVVILSGEAGIGKSRLLQSLTDHIAYEPHTVLECRCSPYHHQSPWHPISDLFRRVLNWQQHTTPEERVAALEHWLAQSQLNLTEAVPLFATLLALPLPADRYPLLALPPQEQRQKILEGLLAYVGALAAQKPLLVIVEDLHWCDPSTLEWLHYLIDHGPMVPFMLCLTCRPTFHPPWGWRAHMTPLIVDHLPADQTTNMVWHLTGGKALPPTVMQHIITTTNGVPLFIEEMAQMFLESELLDEVDSQYTLRVPLSTLSIPHTLQDLLMARLDQLGAAKRTVQLGAVIGRQFSYALLQAVSPLDPETLHRDLERAVKAELLYQRGLPPRATYLFKHALIQEAAYQSLLRRTRQQHHAQIAQKLATDFRDTVETQPQIVAHHYTEAGLGKEALPYWQQAGQLAIERSALSEVIGHLTMGLTVLKTLPDTPARAQQELRLLTTLGPTLIATKGHSALEVEQAYTRARTLCERVGENQQLFLVLNGLRRLYFMRGQIQQAQECGEQLLAVAQRQGQPAQLIEAHLALAQLLTARGEFIAAYTQHQQGFALYDPARHRATPTLYPRDTAVTMHANHGQLLSALGYADQAQEWLSQALTLAQDLDHPFSQAVTLVYAAELHLGRGESLVAGEKATAALALCAEHGLTLFAARATLLRGIALTEQGQSTTGIQLISEGLGALRAQKAEVALLALLPFIAETYRKLGHSEEGYALVTEALTSVEHTGARRWEAELYRLQGEFLLARSSPHIQQAETCFQHALALARRQHAKRAELRAAMSLARLWQQQSRREEARRLLAEVYAWFAEGFDTADLQEARAVLADLA